MYPPASGAGFIPNPIPGLSTAVSPGAIAAAGALPATNWMMAQGTEPAVPVIAGALNAAVEWLKNRKRFREEHWTFPLTVVLAAAAGLGIWWFLQHDAYKAIVNGCGVLSQMHLNYGAIKQSPLNWLGPTAPENKWQAGPAAQGPGGFMAAGGAPVALKG